jgi:excisionase family DNA binding protein
VTKKRKPAKKATSRRRVSNPGGPWMRVSDVSIETLFSVPHIRRAIREGRLRAYRAAGGREVRLHRSDVELWVRGGTAA